MVTLAIASLLIAIIAAVLGFSGMAGSFLLVTKILVVVFLALAVFCFVGSGVGQRTQS